MKFDALDSIVTNSNRVISTSSRFSVLFWFRIASAGENAAGRLFCIPDNGGLNSPDFGMNIRTNSTTNIRVNKSFSGTDGIWDLPSGYSVNRWNCFGMTYDWSATANVPNFWFRDVTTGGLMVDRGTIATVSTPTVNAETPRAGYTVGNSTALNVTADGDICFVQYWDGRFLTTSEFNQASLRPGSVRGNLRLNLWLLNDALDRSGQGAHGTMTAMKSGGMPPGVIPYVPRRILGKAPAGGGGGPTPTAGRKTLLGVGV
jgi:hypothetical protein